MKQDLLSGLGAAAWGARLSKAAVVPNFPMPRVYGIADNLRDCCDVFDVESQSSAITAAMAAVACEKRSFLALDGIQSLQDFCNAAFMRLPLVAAGTTLALRDNGWLMFIPESNQEILDTVIQAYRICEDSSVLLPGFVYLDFPELREPVFIPKEQSIKGFLPNLRLQNKIDAKKPMAIGIPDGLELKAQQQKAMNNALKIIPKVNEIWKKRFKRSYGLVEGYCLEDADNAIVVAGSDALTAKVAVNHLREQGEKVGLLRLRVIRPLPTEIIRDALKNIKRLAVVDKAISIGSSGILYKDIKEGYDGFCSNFIAGRLSEKDFVDIFKQIKIAEKPERFWFL